MPTVNYLDGEPTVAIWLQTKDCAEPALKYDQYGAITECALTREFDMAAPLFNETHKNLQMLGVGNLPKTISELCDENKEVKYFLKFTPEISEDTFVYDIIIFTNFKFLGGQKSTEKFVFLGNFDWDFYEYSKIVFGITKKREWWEEFEDE